MTYSQYSQDDFVLDYFKDKKEPYYVDVGASIDGRDTTLLEESGWKGLCVEPHDHCFKELITTRKCICENVCIGGSSKQVEFCENYGYTQALSGVLEYYSEQHKQFHIYIFW